jgi:hypothetical protein
LQLQSLKKKKRLAQVALQGNKPARPDNASAFRLDLDEEACLGAGVALAMATVMLCALCCVRLCHHSS